MMNEEEKLILKVASDIEISLRIYQDLSNPKSEKFWLSKYVSKESRFYEKLLQEFKDGRRYIVLTKLIEVYEIDKKQCIAHDKLFRMDYKPVYEFLLKYQQDIQSIGKEKPATITESQEQTGVTQPAKRLHLTPNKKEILHSKIIEEVDTFIDAGKGSQDQAFKKLSKNSKKLFGYKLTPKQIEGRYSRTKK
jgi:hypothetical protein